MSSPLRIGIVGLQFGLFHLRTLLQEADFRVVALSDSKVDSPNARMAKQLAPQARFFESGEDLIADSELDAVCLSTSPRRRAPLLRAALKRQLPIFIEKPWAANSTSSRELCAEVHQHSGRVMVGFSFRFHPALVRLRELLQTDLGPAWMANGEYAFEYPVPGTHWLWSPDGGGGFLNENSCHLFDAVCSLLGRPVAITAACANPRNAPGPELAATTLTFESGAVAALTLGAAAAQANEDFPRLDLITAQGQARLQGRHHIWESVHWSLRGGKSSQSYVAPPERLGTTRYTHAWRHFSERVRSGEPFESTPEDGERTVLLAEALLAAADQEKTIHLA